MQILIFLNIKLQEFFKHRYLGLENQNILAEIVYFWLCATQVTPAQLQIIGQVEYNTYVHIN
jgi:hypothetical protein